MGMVSLLVAGCALFRAPAEDERWEVGQLASSLEVGIGTGEVRLVLHVTNATSEAMDFTFPTSQRYDFVVDDGEGREVWRWSAGRAFLQVITESRLEPGETWTMEASWTTGQESGTYVATGRLTAMDRPVEQQTDFELP